jgi:hypothetical protein
MSQLTRSLVVSRAKRSFEINKMKKSLALQVKEGRASAHLMSYELNKSIQLDLKSISQYVSANRNAVSSLILRYKAGRQVSTKALRTRLEADRISLAATVKKILFDFQQVRIAERASILNNASSRMGMVRKSVVTSTPASPAAKTSSPTPASPAAKTSSPTPASPAAKTSSPAPASPAAKTSSPTPASPAAKTSSPTPASPAAKTSSPTPASTAAKTSSPTPASPAAKTKNPTLPAFPFKTSNSKK